jgi:hypothetical protein
MSYGLKIKAIELIIKDIDLKIDNLTKSENKDENILRNLTETRYNMMNDLRRLNKLDYEENYQRVGYDDDR